jgi:hypothetical protein
MTLGASSTVCVCVCVCVSVAQLLNIVTYVISSTVVVIYEQTREC